MKKGYANLSLVVIFTLTIALFVLSIMQVYGKLNMMNREKALRVYTDGVAASMDLTDAFQEDVTINTSAPSFNSSFDFQNHRIRGRARGFLHSLRGGWGEHHMYNTFHISSEEDDIIQANGSETIVVRNGKIVEVIG